MESMARSPSRERRPTSSSAMGSNTERGLPTKEATSRRTTYGPNEITAEEPPRRGRSRSGSCANPMNIMLIAVTVVSLAIGEVSTAVIVALLILLNVVLGTRQELKARASVDALSNLQVPQAKALRDGSGRADPGRRPRSGRHRAARGGRHRARRRPHRAIGDAVRRRRPP